MRLLTNNPRKFVGIEGYGLSVSEAVPLEIPVGEHTRRYLKTKKDKLGHKLSVGVKRTLFTLHFALLTLHFADLHHRSRL